jgi:uncharacterized lipoprotein YddW (UPF0748 family)
MRFRIAGVCLLGLGVSCAQPRPHPQPATPAKPAVEHPGEIRAVWVSDTARLNWDEATRQLQRAGFNTMYVNLASGGAAFFPHCRAVPSVVDDEAIARGIALAHQRGIAVHAKLIVMFMFKTPTEFQRRLLRQDRVMRGEDGKPILQSGFTWLCPSRPENFTQVAATMTEMLSRYPVDGVQFDYIRFNENPSCYCSVCRRDAGQFGGEFNDWRLQVINDWARRLSRLARQMRPGLKVSAAVYPILERAKEEKAQDWRLWLQRGYLDYVCTMNYTPDNREFEQRCRAAGTDRVVEGIGSWKMKSLVEVQAQIEIGRRLGAPGFALFSYDDAAARNFLPALH